MRRSFLLAAAVTLAASALTPLARAAPAPTDAGVTVTVADITPSVPVPSATPRPLIFTLTLTNTTAVDIPKISITAERGDPISTQPALDDALAGPHAPTPALVAPVHTDPLQVGTLAAGASTTVDYATTTSTSTGAQTGICLCNDTDNPLYIYPIIFTATSTTSDGATALGTGETFFPSLGSAAVAPVQTSWVWPLLDVPHRLGSEKIFLDDDLSVEVAPDGRLDRALRAIELLSPQVPVTLLVDPDLLDELEVMAAGSYRVYDDQVKGGTVAGAGRDVAQAWLTRFRTLLAQRPEVQVELTPFADPDIDSLARSGLDWAALMTDQAAQRRLSDALADRSPQREIVWPTGGMLSADTLAQVVRDGAGAVILNDRALPRNSDSTTANALAQVQTAAGATVAAVTSTRLERYVHSILQPTGAGLAALPDLISELALRIAPDTSRFVVLTPPRLLDVDPAVAARTITATSRSFWNTGLALDTATRTVTPSDHGVLHTVRGRPRLPDEALDVFRQVADALPDLSGPIGLFDTAASRSTTANSTALSPGKLAIAAQRSASAEFIDDPERAVAQSRVIADRIDRVRRAVHLVTPAGNASYTLTATDAPLPVTVTNTLGVPVQARVSVTAVDNLPGFEASSKDVHLAANSTQQLHIPTRITITGRIQVLITLSTRNNRMTLGNGPLQVSVRNTALGTVGVAITTTAAIILALALLFRLYRALRWRRRRRLLGELPPTTLDPLAP